MLDLEVLFDPLEKEFHMPPHLVEFADVHGRAGHVVCQEAEAFPGFRIHIGHATQQIGVEIVCTTPHNTPR